MRHLLYTAAAAVGLATASIANAAVTVNSPSVVNLNNPTPTVVTVDGTTTINFGLNPVTNNNGAGNFTSGFIFSNNNAGLYSIVVSTSDFIDGTTTPVVAFTSGVLSLLTGCTPGTFTGCTSTNVANLNVTDNGAELRLGPPSVYLGAGDYRFTINGTSPNSGSFTGNITIKAAAVPEAGTWAMMLVGFAGMGLTLRRRRHQVLAQVA